ncbi:MAG: oligopeptide/dipeptide ABC transporter ATP-binding protein, partial [Smithella sp.]
RPSGCVDAQSAGEAYLKTIPGAVPSLYALPSGCRFSERCALVEEACRVREPELMEIEEGHFVACFVAEQEKDCHCEQTLGLRGNPNT